MGNVESRLKPLDAVTLSAGPDSFRPRVERVVGDACTSVQLLRGSSCNAGSSSESGNDSVEEHVGDWFWSVKSDSEAGDCS